MIRISHKQFPGYLFLITSAFCLLVYFISGWTYRYGISGLAEQGRARLELYATYLQGVLEKYESLPELLATDSKMISLLKNPGSRDRIGTLNQYLETINRISDASDTYLMDDEGLTIAASNWNEPRPFVGRNFSYRPYFKEAMKGNLGRYFALGTTSSRRGYYFAYPVRHAKQILGALVVKINIDSVEQTWDQNREAFLVTDPDGVIFLTTFKNWRFRTLNSLNEEVIKRLEESRRYPNASLTPLNIVGEMEVDGRKIISVRLDGEKKPHSYLLQKRYMEQAGWHVQILSETNEVEKYVLLINVLLVALFTLGGLIHLLVRQRGHRLEELKRFEEESRKVLEEANEKLETRVLERTAELTESNMLLRKEIEDRKKTEKKLEQTRSELIHAAKLAVLGQMSAGINHELNQPLAAIRSYSDNGKLFLEKGRLEDTLWNLEQISELTDRMAQIGVQLKVFTRKSSGSMTKVPLHSVIDGALEILKPVLRKVEATVEYQLDPQFVEVEANNVLLQQVMVNLLSNAVQAVEGLEERLVSISAERDKGWVKVAVQDSGKGVTEDILPQIFEPFFTTKKSGHGLGLGLAITERILKEMNGSISVVACSQGARFEFRLKEA